MGQVTAWLASGNRCKELGVNFKIGKLQKIPDLLYITFFEYIQEFDVTLLYVRSDNPETGFVYTAYDKEWFDDVFTFLQPTGKPSLLYPIRNRIFYSNNGLDIPKVFEGVVQELSWFRPKKRFFDGAESVLLQVGRLHCDARPAEDLFRHDLTQRVEVFMNLNVPGDYIDLKHKKYAINIKEEFSGEVECYSKVEFNALDEIKGFFRQKNWDKIASGIVTPWNTLSVNLSSARAIEELTIPYLLVTDTIVRA